MKTVFKNNILNRLAQKVFWVMLMFSFGNVKSQNVRIELNKLFINNVPFDSASLINDYIKVLGKPNRVVEVANNIYVYDSLGIYIYENYKDSNKILEISFDLKKSTEFDFSPKHKFSGTIFLKEYNYTITKHTGFRKIKKLCKIHNNSSLQSEFGDSDINYGNFNLLFEHNFFQTLKNFTIYLRVRKYRWVE